MTSTEGYRVSWNTVGPELGEGEYHVRLYGPREHTAWTEVYSVVKRAPNPLEAAREMLSSREDQVASLPRWRVTVQVGRQPAALEDQDPAVLVGVFMNERGR